MPSGTYIRQPRDRAQLFWRHVDPCRTDGCMVWVGSISNGYGQFWDGQRIIKAHYFLAGPPPKGLVWDHVKERGCTNRNCVWPKHLEAVTHAENVRRGRGGEFWAAKTHCPRGHPYNEANTRIYQGRRFCRECARVQSREWWRRHK